MKRHGSFIAAAGALTLCAASPAVAQGVPATARSEAQQRQQRYQIGQMERVLEGAVEHGAAMMRDRLQAVVPPAQAQLLFQENAHVRRVSPRRLRHVLRRHRAVARRLADVEPADARSERSRPPKRAHRAQDAHQSRRHRHAAGPEAHRAAGGSGHARRAHRAGSAAAGSSKRHGFGRRRTGSAGRGAARQRHRNLRRGGSRSSTIRTRRTAPRSSRRSSMPCSTTAARSASARANGSPWPRVGTKSVRGWRRPTAAPRASSSASAAPTWRRSAAARCRARKSSSASTGGCFSGVYLRTAFN